jgi:phosphohistidine phosphatase
MEQVPSHFYTQSAVIPYRQVQGQFEVLLITTRKKKRWVIPKGVMEPELSAADSATKEALEEAGIRGLVSASPIGSYAYDKWGGTCTVQVHTMGVREILDEWQESYRDREWVSIEEAVARVREPDLKQLMRQLPAFHASLNEG